MQKFFYVFIREFLLELPFWIPPRAFAGFPPGFLTVFSSRVPSGYPTGVSSEIACGLLSGNSPRVSSEKTPEAPSGNPSRVFPANLSEVSPKDPSEVPSVSPPYTSGAHSLEPCRSSF